ncbi:MAG TPA: TetR family transcriptional regulator [Baekduia sp.]
MTATDITGGKVLDIARWQPHARTRLEAAALDLFDERGYEATTAAEIAARADLTERTFFRHFADKREVLFANEDTMLAALVAGVREAPDDRLSVPDLVRAGLDAVAVALQPRRDDLRRRAAIIATHPALHERELMKQTATAATLAQVLQERGVDATLAPLAADVAIVALRTAFDRWIADAERRPLSDLVTETLDQLDRVTRAPRPAAAPATRRG